MPTVAATTFPLEIWLRTEDRREVAEMRHKLAAALTDDPRRSTFR